MRYTTAVCMCAEGDHEIEDAPVIEQKGYTSPEVLTWESYTSGPKQETSYRQPPRKRLCKKHYLEAFALRYPESALPEL